MSGCVVQTNISAMSVHVQLQRTRYLCVHAGGHELVVHAKEGMGCVYDPVKERGHSCTVLHNVESPC